MAIAGMIFGFYVQTLILPLASPRQVYREIYEGFPYKENNDDVLRAMHDDPLYVPKATFIDGVFFQAINRLKKQD